MRTAVYCKIAFFGNPGAGKSTLLNCLMVMKHGKVEPLFRSGVNIAKGLTYKLEQKTIGDYVYMDTPGLDDVEMRKQASKAISEALKQGGMYLIVFIVRESSGKIYPSDLATIKTVLQSAPEIKHYGVIINKLSKPIYDKFSIEENRSRIQNLFESINRSKIVSILFLQNISELEDEDNVVVNIPSLRAFVDNQPKNKVNDKNVGDVDQNVHNMESQIEDLRRKQEENLREFELQKKNAELKRKEEIKKREQERERLEKELQRQREEQERKQQENYESNKRRLAD